MKTPPLENEKGPVITGASLSDLEFEQATDGSIINQSGAKVNLIAAAYDGDRLVPTVEHFTREPEQAEVYTADRKQLAALMLSLNKWAYRDVRTAKAAALEIYLGHDRRLIREIADDFGLTANGIRTALRDLKAHVDAFKEANV